MTEAAWLRTVTVVALALGALAAAAGLFWEPPGNPVEGRSDLYGLGLYRRDTPFTAGGAQGSDLLTLLVVVPAALGALAGRRDRRRMLVIAVAHAWLVYLSASLSLGAIAFNELFPLYVVLVPLSTFGLALALRGLGAAPTPRWLPAFLLACGMMTEAAWSLLLWLEMTTGAFPPATYYTARTTYALDLGLIAPGCVAAAVALWRGWAWGVALAVPLLSIAALLLPMMALQTVLQLRAGVAFGAEAAAPFLGFSVLSAGAVFFLWRLVSPAHSSQT
jgi:hypothetical protein